MNRRFNPKAFTLVELLVVMAILGLLFTVGSYTIASVSAKSRNDTRKQDLKHVQAALEQYATDQRSYPPIDAALVSGSKPAFSAVWQLSANPSCAHTATTAKNITPSYLTTIPEDPHQSVNFASQSCSNIVNSQNNRYLYITNNAGTGVASTYGLLATLERQTNPIGMLIDGNITINAPYQFTADPFANAATAFGAFYKAHTNTDVDANYIVTGGASR